MSTRDDAGARRHFLVRIAGQRFAIPAEQVEALVPETAVRALGAMPAHVPGVIRYDGHWIPVVNPTPLLGLLSAPGGAAAVLRRGAQAYALLIDGSDGELMVPEDEIETDHDAVGGIRQFVEDRAGAITLLDVDTLFRTPAPHRIDSHARGRHAAPEARVVLVFSVGRYRLALPAECVLATRPIAEMNAAQQNATGLLGTIAYDGGRIPVFSLAARLRAADARPAHLLVVATSHAPVVLAVDHIRGVVSVAVHDAGDDHRLLQRILAPGIRGVLRSDAGPLVELDVAGIVERDASGALRAAESAASPTDA